MILDGRNTTLATDQSYDLIIVGAGPAGITLAHELADTGLRIALLESGGLEFDPDTQELYDATLTGNDETDMLAGRLRFLGGTSNHWGGHCLPLDRLDIERAPLSGMTGWPLSYDELLTYYPRGHAYCDLGRFDYDVTQPSGPSPDKLLLVDDPEISTVVFRQSPPTRFGEKYASWLEQVESVELWLWTNVVDLISDADGRIGDVVTRTLSGVERRFRAETVVLACGSVETARLLLYTNARNGRSFGNRGDLLGRCYLDHPSGGAAFIDLVEPMPDKAYWMPADHFRDEGVPIRFLMRLSEATIQREGLGNCQFILIPFAGTPEEQARRRSAAQSAKSLKAIGKWAVNHNASPTFSLSKEYCSFITNADSFVAEEWAQLTGNQGVTRILLKYEAEQQPDRSNAVTLIEATDALGLPRINLNWSPSRDDLESVKKSAELIGAAVGRAGLGRLRLEKDDGGPYWNSVTAWHQLGTTRMAAAESDGVVDPDCKVFGTANLYVASGGVMPTSGRANPTLTIVSLTIRLADHLKQRANL
jgi:choline dehydrogenase-like flavoprotein